MKSLICYFVSLMIGVCMFSFQSLTKHNRWSHLLFIVSLLINFNSAQAQVSVTSGGTVNMCVGGGFITIPDFKITEKVNTDFISSANVQTYELDVPSGFEFNPSIGSVLIPATTDISFASLTITATKITLFYLLNTTSKRDSFIFKSIQVHAINSSSSKDLLFTGGNALQNKNIWNQYVHARFNSTQSNVTLNASQHVVCANVADITLSGSPGGGNYTVAPSSSGLTGNIFKPAVAGSGSFIITYTANHNGCLGSDTAHITVKPIPSVIFSGVENSYCSNDADVVLTGLPVGGTFSGNGVVGNTFKPNTLPAGIASITYSYTNAVGCTNAFTKSGINILKAPSVTIYLNPDKSTYSTTSGAVAISGTQTNPSAGGIVTVSGNGVSNIRNEFSPGAAGEGTFDITRTLVASNGCIAKANKTVTVANPSGTNIIGLLPKYCVGDGIFELSSSNGKGVFLTGPGITNINPVNGTATFSPDGIVFARQDTIITIYCEFPTLGFMYFQPVKIFNKPEVYIQQDERYNAAGFKTDFCRSDGIVQLDSDVFPVGGIATYSGPGVEFVSSSYVFNPKSASEINTITVKYSDPNGCVNTDSKIANVHGEPVPYFSVSSFCEGDVIHLKDSASTVLGSGINDVITKWKWLVDDVPYITQNTDVTLAVGNHTIKYTTTTKAGCTATSTKSVFIGPYPAVVFSWEKVCNGDVTKFLNATAIPNGLGRIETIKWSFINNKDVILTAPATNPSVSYWNYENQYSKPGVYTVIQTATTNMHCTSIDSQKVFIFPSITVGSDSPYNTDFESNDGGWISSTSADTASSWAWGLTNKSIIKPALNNDRFWVTNLNGVHKMDEHSYVYSPCFVLDDITRPMIHMDIWSATSKNLAGANVQYSFNGIDWKTLGDTKSGGINWYNNETQIAARPSGNASLYQNGWTGNDLVNGWKNVRHVLDDALGNNKQIRFRISFAGTNDRTDGFAFDNIWIGNRTRLIIAEHFTNNSSLNTKQENASLNDLITGNLFVNNEPKDIVQLQYHTAFPGFDPMNQRNIPDPGARALYYGVTQVPYSCVDGSYFNGSAFKIDTNMVDTRALYDPAFEFVLNPVVTATAVSGNIEITNKIPVKNNVTVYISLLERYVNKIPGNSGESTYEWVHAKFLPNAAGTSFLADWSGQKTKTINLGWAIPAGYFYDDKKVAMIAFVQDNVTKEIYQAAYKPIGATVITNTFEPNEATSTVSLYPNPANDVTTVVLNGKLKGSYSWLIFDELGRVVDEGSLQDGTEGFTINTQNYASGFYTLRLSNSSDGVKTQKFVVVH